VTDNHHEKLRNNNRAGDRRLKRRYRIEQDVRYKMLYGQRVAETGSGKTTNISSGGVCFTTDSILSIGIPVELSMNWPVLLNQSCLLKLMIYGCVVRSTDKGSAMVIERYEFRTQGKGARRVEAMELGL
jgi:c-di-GMP-binding flagellar brake protein YcgR